MLSPPRSTDKPDFPWWLLAAGAIALFLATQIVLNDLYSQIFSIVSKGVGITIFVTLVGFALATAIGLVLAIMGLSRFLVLRQIARFYVEIIRGIPILVLLFYIAFVGAPGFVIAWNFLMTPLIEAGLVEPMSVRDVSLLWRAIIALTIGYSAFIAEVFPRRHPVGRCGPGRGRQGAGALSHPALPLHRATAGDPHHPAAAGQ